MPKAIYLFLTIAVAAFALASSVHGGVLLAGWEHGKAATAEGVIAIVLALGLMGTWISPTHARGIALAVLGLALLGTLVGAFTIGFGIGPQTKLDLAFHAVLLLGLIGTLVAIWRVRTHATGSVAHERS